MLINKNHPLYKKDIENVLSINGINSFKDKSILITGATGMLGVHLIDAFMALDKVNVYAVGRNKEKARMRLGEYFNNPFFHFIEQDVCHPFAEDLKVDYIIPGASNTHPLAYSQYPIETIMINIKGAENALELASRCKAEVLYLSSVEIYGNTITDGSFCEEDTGLLNLTSSRSCYTESKRVCESLCQSYIAERNINVKIARLSRIFGPTMLESDSKAASQFIKKALANENIILKSNGEQFFSYTYVTDAVSAMLYIMLHGKCGQAYNVSNEKCNVHLKEFAQLCAEYTQKKVVFDLPTEDEIKGFSIAKNAILDNSKLKSIGFYPKYEIKDSIKRTLEILS